MEWLGNRVASLWPVGPVSRGCFRPLSDQVARPRSAAGEAVFPRVQVFPGDSDAGATAARATRCLLLALKGRQCLFLKYGSIFKNALLRGLFPGLLPSYLSKGDDISSFWRSHSNLDKDKLTLRRIFKKYSSRPCLWCLGSSGPHLACITTCLQKARGPAIREGRHGWEFQPGGGVGFQGYLGVSQAQETMWAEATRSYDRGPSSRAGLDRQLGVGQGFCKNE